MWDLLQAQQRFVCLISRLELDIEEKIDYNDLAELILDEPARAKLIEKALNSDTNGQGKNSQDHGDPDDPYVRLKHDCVAIIAAFKFKEPYEHYIIVANAHIYWKFSFVIPQEIQNLLQRAKLREVASLEGHVLLKKLGAALEYLRNVDVEKLFGDVANKADNNENDVDRVSESSFMHENDTAHKDVNSYKKESDEPKFPPGFTPDNNDREKNVEENIKDTTEQLNERRNLWDYLRTFIDRREDDTVIMGDFNEVRSKHE
nr:DNAse I-like superfamily protein [Tanacetum cinerariifolium]